MLPATHVSACVSLSVLPSVPVWLLAVDEIVRVLPAFTDLLGPLLNTEQPLQAFCFLLKAPPALAPGFFFPDRGSEFSFS